MLSKPCRAATLSWYSGRQCRPNTCVSASARSENREGNGFYLFGQRFELRLLLYLGADFIEFFADLERILDGLCPLENPKIL